MRKDCSNVEFVRYTTDKKHVPVNLIVPMHLSHYDIVQSIISKSPVSKDIYVHDNADLVHSGWAVKEFNRVYSSIKENKRLNQAGIPKVVSGDIHRHAIINYHGDRDSVLTRHPKILHFIKSAQKMALIENTEYEADYYENDENDTDEEEEKETPAAKKENALKPIQKQMQNELLILYERWRNVTEEVQIIMTFQNPMDWASEMFYDSENENLGIESDPEIIIATYFKLIQYYTEACAKINKAHGKRCFWTRIEDIIANPSSVFHAQNLHPYDHTKKYLKKLNKKREKLIENLAENELEDFRDEFSENFVLKNLGYSSGEADKLSKPFDDLYIYF